MAQSNFGVLLRLAHLVGATQAWIANRFWLHIHGVINIVKSMAKIQHRVIKAGVALEAICEKKAIYQIASPFGNAPAIGSFI